MRLQKSTIEKVSSSCNVDRSKIIAVHNVASTYLVPALLEEQGLLPSLSRLLLLDDQHRSLDIANGSSMWHNWNILTAPRDDSCGSVTIALVGKYTSFMDSYISVLKALEHSVMSCKRKLNLVAIDSSHLEETSPTSLHTESDYAQAWGKVRQADGVLIPGGFGTRGTEGMIAAARWARESKTPFLGICLGMQIAVIEFARHMCNIPEAGSVELSPDCLDPVIIFMPEIDKKNMGGTMRLGSRLTVFQSGSTWSKVRELYSQKDAISERHRHRYEVNPKYIERINKRGLHFVGTDEDGLRMEIIELNDHPWYVGVQFHPEYQSRVLQPSRPFLGFVSAAISHQVLEPDRTLQNKLTREVPA